MLDCSGENDRTTTAIKEAGGVPDARVVDQFVVRDASVASDHPPGLDRRADAHALCSLRRPLYVACAIHAGLYYPPDHPCSWPGDRVAREFEHANSSVGACALISSFAGDVCVVATFRRSGRLDGIAVYGPDPATAECIRKALSNLGVDEWYQRDTPKWAFTHVFEI
jgi:hypothetical protein